jgi:hypothetical protein
MKRIVAIVLLFAVNFSLAQPSSINRKKNPYRFMFGLSWSAIDDDGNAFGNLFDYQGSWNYLPFPTRLSLDKYVRKGLSLEGIVTYNTYTTSKIINNTTGVSGIFVSGDFHMKYSFNRFMPSAAKWFDPYLSGGLGLTFRSVRDTPLNANVNLGFGMNFWLNQRWGLQLQTVGKLALVSDIYASDADYIQHTVGIVYRMQPLKRPFKQGKAQYKWVHGKQHYKRKNTG